MRYTFSIPENLYHQISDIAKDQGVSISDVVRQFLRVGLMAMSDGEFFYREANSTQETIIKFPL